MYRSSSGSSLKMENRRSNTECLHKLQILNNLFTCVSEKTRSSRTVPLQNKSLKRVISSRGTTLVSRTKSRLAFLKLKLSLDKKEKQK